MAETRRHAFPANAIAQAHLSDLMDQVVQGHRMQLIEFDLPQGKQ